MANFWLALDERACGDALRDLLSSLEKLAGETGEGREYSAITTNAQIIAESLRELDPDLAAELMESWPAAPELTPEQSAANERGRRAREERKLWGTLSKDIDAGLAELRRLEEEGGGVRLNARSLALERLFSNNQVDEAQQLLEETMTLAADLPRNRSNFQHLENLLGLAIRLGTQDQQERLFQLWAAAAESVDLPPRPENLSGVKLTPVEGRILSGLQRLSENPELALQALEQFPDLKKKVQSIGGLGAVQQEQRRNWGEQARESARGRSELEIEMGRAINAGFAGPQGIQEFNRKAERLEDLIRSLPLLNDPLTEAGLFQNAIHYYFSFRGELPIEIRKQGLEYVEIGRRDNRDSNQPGTPAGLQLDVERLEANIYAMWLWSDAQEAALAVEKLPPETRLRALGSYLTNLTSISCFGTWRLQ